MKERCWIVYKDRIVAIRNISGEESEFLMDPEEIYSYVDGITGIVHTHDRSCVPSPLDLEGMKNWRVPWIIVSRECIKSYMWSDLGVTEVKIHASLLKELHDLLMHPF